MDFEKFLKDLEKEAFSDGKYAVCKTYANYNVITAKQLGQILTKISFSKDKIKAAELFLGKLTDPWNINDAVQTLSFSSDKDAIRKLFENAPKPMPQQQNFPQYQPQPFPQQQPYPQPFPQQQPYPQTFPQQQPYTQPMPQQQPFFQPQPYPQQPQPYPQPTNVQMGMNMPDPNNPMGVQMNFGVPSQPQQGQFPQTGFQFSMNFPK